MVEKFSTSIKEAQSSIKLPMIHISKLRKLIKYNDKVQKAVNIYWCSYQISRQAYFESFELLL